MGKDREIHLSELRKERPRSQTLFGTSRGPAALLDTLLLNLSRLNSRNNHNIHDTETTGIGL